VLDLETDSKVKIRSIEAVEIEIPYNPPFCPAWAPGIEQRGRGYTIVKLVTTDGVIGWGGSAHRNEAQVINKIIKPYLEGKDLFATEQHIKKLRVEGGVWCVEIAIWDAVGKTIGVPLYKIWGGYKDKILAYASVVQVSTPEKRAEDALNFLELGFKVIKLRAHYWDMKDDIRLVEKVREAVGDRIEIMVDANQAFEQITPLPDPKWDYRRAKMTALEYQNLGVVWLEEPLPRHNIKELHKLCEEVDILIAGGEVNKGLYELGHLVEWDVYDVLQPDATNCEGLSQLRKIAALCELKNKWFIPHHGMGAIGLYAHLHLSCSIPNSPYLEYIYDPPYRTIEDFLGMGGIVLNLPRIDKEGYISVPESPGLGVEIDEKAIQRYIV